jgi:ribonuclease HI
MTAVFQWSKSGWKNREGKPVDNADLWKDFVRAFRGSSKRTELEWVKGHGRGSQKDPHNYAADKLADASARSPLSRREYRSSVRRKVTPHKTMVGSIEACGQTIVVHIVETVWLKVQRTWKYRCEVMSAESPDYQQMDWLYSDHQMRDGHYYEVTLNDNPKNPMIVAVLREVVSDARERAVSGTQSTPR